MKKVEVKVAYRYKANGKVRCALPGDTIKVEDTEAERLIGKHLAVAAGATTEIPVKNAVEEPPKGTARKPAVKVAK